MAFTQTRSGTSASAAADAIVALADGGFLRIYDGIQPVNADTSLSGQTLLAELQFGTPAFGAATDGIALANSISDEDSVLEDGIASWFRVYSSDGTTSLWDGSVGDTGFNLNLDSLDFITGDVISVTSFAFVEELS